jgi:hypothetical protein
MNALNCGDQTYLNFTLPIGSAIITLKFLTVSYQLTTFKSPKRPQQVIYSVILDVLKLTFQQTFPKPFYLFFFIE